MRSMPRLPWDELNLDDPTIDSVKFEYLADEQCVLPPDEERWEPSMESYFLWLSALFKDAIERSATKIILQINRASRSLEQVLIVQGREVALVPMQWTTKNLAFQFISRLANVRPFGKKGVIRYLSCGRARVARVIRNGANQYEIYFGPDTGPVVCIAV